MNKNERERTERFLEAQTFTMAVMQSLMDSSAGSKMHELASNANQIAIQAIAAVVEEHPKMSKTVDKILSEIVVTNEQS
jgi:cytidylate kinase